MACDFRGPDGMTFSAQVIHFIVVLLFNICYNDSMNAIIMAEGLSARLKDLVARSRELDAEIAAGLLEMKRRGWYRCLAYPRVEDFAWVVLEIPQGKAKELVALAERLEGLPRIKEAFEAGQIEWTKARTIARIASVGDEEYWLAEAASSTNRGLERRVAEEKGEKAKVRIVLLPPRSPRAQHAPSRASKALS